MLFIVYYIVLPPKVIQELALTPLTYMSVVGKSLGSKIVAIYLPPNHISLEISVLDETSSA